MAPMTVRHPRPDRAVLIVGAGPVGLMLGCELLLRGIEPRIVSAAPRTTGQSRAILIWPRILELLDRVGVADRVVDEGHRVTSVGYHYRGRLLGRARMDLLEDTPFPFACALPQSGTERILLERLRALGGAVQWGTTLTSVLDPEQGRVLLTHDDGLSEEVNDSLVVGADGAHSTVRAKP